MLRLSDDDLTKSAAAFRLTRAVMVYPIAEFTTLDRILAREFAGIRL